MPTGTASAIRAATLSVALAHTFPTPPAEAETIYGITGAFAGVSLVRFESTNPASHILIGPLTGVLPRHAVRGIDFRPATGSLYAVSNDNTRAQLYTLDPSTAVLTPVGPGFTFPSDPYARLSIDFNPTTDELRLVTGNGFNLRIDPNTGAATFDAPLHWSPGDTNAGATPFAADIAHSNNTPGAPTTTLYAYDFTSDVVAIQGGRDGLPPPETGLWNTLGPSGVVVIDAGVGFDISAATGTAYASYTRLGVDAFASVNLGTGRFTEIGAFLGIEMLDIAVTIPPPCAADFNNDGAVNTPDLIYFLGRFGATPLPGSATIRADFNADGRVDTFDLASFLARYARPCP